MVWTKQNFRLKNKISLSEEDFGPFKTNFCMNMSSDPMLPSLVSVYYLAREISPTIEQSDPPKFHDISSHAKVYLCNLLARISPKFGRSHYFHGSRRLLFFNELFFNVLPCKIYTPVAKGMKIKISKSGRIFMVHLELIFGSISHDRRRIKSPF